VASGSRATGTAPPRLASEPTGCSRLKSQGNLASLIGEVELETFMAEYVEVSLWPALFSSVAYRWTHRATTLSSSSPPPGEQLAIGIHLIDEEPSRIEELPEKRDFR
jgi:hypothetical protein